VKWFSARKKKLFVYNNDVAEMVVVDSDFGPWFARGIVFHARAPSTRKFIQLW
jgi:hypothetical protein